METALRLKRSAKWPPEGAIGEGSHRASIVAAGPGEAAAALQTVAASAPAAAGSGPGIAFLFPGLGAGGCRLAAPLLDADPHFADYIARADSIVARRTGAGVVERLRAGGMPAGAAGGPKRLFQASSAESAPPSVDHPLLFAVEVALAKSWIAWGCSPAALLGYSLGELAAACVAGVFSFEDALELVCRRAELIETLPPGRMIAAAASPELIAPLMPEGVHIVADNHGATVVGGTVEAVGRLQQTLAGQAILTLPIGVSHALHTPLMEPIRDRIVEAVAAVARTEARLPVYSTVRGRLLGASEPLDPEYWGDQLCGPIQFLSALDQVRTAGAHLFIEVGPGQGLSSIVELTRIEGEVIVPSLSSGEDAGEAMRRLLTGIGRAWTAGADIRTSPEFPFAEVADRTPALPASPTMLDAVFRAWTEVFDSPPSADSDFFALGGNSLRAGRLAIFLSRALGREVSLRAVYAHPTPARLASALDWLAAEAPDSDGSVVNLRVAADLEVRIQSVAEARYFYRSIFEEESYIRHGIVLPHGSTILDVGANIGMFALFVARHSPTSRIFCLEPAPPLFEILEENLRRHQVNARAIPKGASDERGTSPFLFYPESSGMSSFDTRVEEDENVLRAIIANEAGPDRAEAGLDSDLAARLRSRHYDCELTTISCLIDDHGIEEVGLLKIDVQKSEMKVLHGIEARHWPIIGQIVVEVHDIDGRLQEMSSLLEDRGFEVICEQDPLYLGTDIFNLYARRPRPEPRPRGLAGEARA